MDCSDCNDAIIRDLKRALRSNDIKREVVFIIKKYGKKRVKKAAPKSGFYVRAGEAYYVKSTSNNRESLVYKIFQQILNNNFRGLWITRENPDNWAMASVLENTKFYWLTNVKKDTAIAPSNLPKLLAIIKDFLKAPGRSVVVIDGINALILNNGFNSVLKFIQTVKDAVSESHGILLISVNMQALQAQEAELLKNELIDITKRK